VAANVRPHERPAFFLAEEGGLEAPCLRDDDAEHALRVLRLGAGDALDGLDGRGNRLPLRIARVERGRAVLAVAGSVASVPEPGQEGSALPWFEVAVGWPRRTRVEDMVGRLVQLGAAAIRPLLCERRGPEEPPRHPGERLLRVAREACKQSGRLWLPEFGEPLAPRALAEARSSSPIAVLAPRAGLPLDTWLRSLRPSPLGTGTRARPIVLAIGPEGGWAPEELEALEVLGASRVALGPHVLRVETAAEAAMAVAGVVHARGTSGGPD
jgi:16S rRNA (uracil1498-N3)-methyltransferase